MATATSSVHFQAPVQPPSQDLSHMTLDSLKDGLFRKRFSAYLEKTHFKPLGEEISKSVWSGRKGASQVQKWADQQRKLFDALPKLQDYDPSQIAGLLYTIDSLILMEGAIHYSPSRNPLLQHFRTLLLSKLVGLQHLTADARHFLVPNPEKAGSFYVFFRRGDDKWFFPREQLKQNEHGTIYLTDLCAVHFDHHHHLNDEEVLSARFTLDLEDPLTKENVVNHARKGTPLDFKKMKFLADITFVNGIPDEDWSANAATFTFNVTLNDISLRYLPGQQQGLEIDVGSILRTVAFQAVDSLKKYAIGEFLKKLKNDITYKPIYALVLPAFPEIADGFIEHALETVKANANANGKLLEWLAEIIKPKLTKAIVEKAHAEIQDPEPFVEVRDNYFEVSPELMAYILHQQYMARKTASVSPVEEEEAVEPSQLIGPQAAPELLSEAVTKPTPSAIPEVPSDIVVPEPAPSAIPKAPSDAVAVVPEPTQSAIPALPTVAAPVPNPTLAIMPPSGLPKAAKARETTVAPERKEASVDRFSPIGLLLKPKVRDQIEQVQNGNPLNRREFNGLVQKLLVLRRAAGEVHEVHAGSKVKYHFKMAGKPATGATFYNAHGSDRGRGPGPADQKETLDKLLADTHTTSASSSAAPSGNKKPVKPTGPVTNGKDAARK